MTTELQETTSLGVESAEVLGFTNEEELLEALVPLMKEIDMD